jgi:hypothetical protein
MATQRFMGSGQLINRLIAQVGDKSLAIGILKKRGDMTDSGKLTAKGRSRNNMTAEERAKDRASKASGKPESSFIYNPKTNTTKLK